MFKVISDSAIDVAGKMMERYPVVKVPFKMNLGEIVYVDDENLDVEGFVKDMGESSKLPKSACPSPSDFYENMKGTEDRVYLITISDKLSGTYSCAKLSEKMFKEECGKDKKIHVFNSKSASGGQLIINKMIHELENAGDSFETIIEKIESFVNEQMTTLFVAENLDNLIKNGRISKMKGKIASKLKITPLMGTDDGEIVLRENARTPKKAYQKLVESIKNTADGKISKTIVISHANNIERANLLKEAIEELKIFEEIMIIKCNGLTSMYVDNQGIIVTY